MMGVSQANLDLVVPQDTKFTYGVYTHELDGYSVVSMGALIQYCDRVVVFYMCRRGSLSRRCRSLELTLSDSTW